MIKKIKNNKLLLALILPFLILIIVVTAKIVSGKELLMDKIAYNILVENLRSPTLTTIMKTITKLSNTSFITTLAVVLTILFFYIIKNKKLAVSISLNLLCIATLNQFLKMIFQRQRPIGYRLIEMTGYSYPSGHAMASLAFYGLIIYIIHRLVKKRSLRIFLISINVVIILLVGISRVYLGVHYLSDVIAGYSISIIYLLIVTKILNKYKVFP